MQGKLYAQEQWSLLLIFQAMDAAGKDGAIKHVMSGVNPQGARCSLQGADAEELQHDFLWRARSDLPERGRIGIFNRSYYEEVLVVRVHPEMLAQEVPPRTGDQRHLEGALRGHRRVRTPPGPQRHEVLKFFLNISKRRTAAAVSGAAGSASKELEILPRRQPGAGFWSGYVKAYEDMIRRTATGKAPWHVVPADHKWFTRLVVAAVIVETLRSLKLEYPRLDAARRKELGAARAALLRTK